MIKKITNATNRCYWMFDILVNRMQPTIANRVIIQKFGETKRNETKPNKSTLMWYWFLAIANRFEISHIVMTANPGCAISNRKRFVSQHVEMLVFSFVYEAWRILNIGSLHIIFLMIYKHSWISVIDFYYNRISSLIWNISIANIYKCFALLPNFRSPSHYTHRSMFIVYGVDLIDWLPMLYCCYYYY